MSAPRITLDQWAALVAVVEAGGYAQASARLHRTQSTVTYTIKKLEDLLGVKVFELQGRKAVLTPTGQALFRRGKALLDEAARVERAAADLARGWEPEIRLAVDIVFPTWLLLECLAEFLGDPLMQVRFVCAAAPSHPLHQLGRTLTLDDLRHHRHLVVRDSGAARSRSGGNWLNEQRWTVSHKATSIRAARMGLGYAWYPEENIREELASGALVPLPLAEGRERYVTLYLIFADADTAGPGARRLADIVRTRVAVAHRPAAS
jgi:DNA-binding transcriptional LysR family regulator